MKLLIMLAFIATPAFSAKTSFIMEAASKSYVDRMFEKVSKKVQVPEPLIRAICYSESRHQPSAYVYGDGGKGNHAFGLCQVLRKTAAQFVRVDESCKNDFRGKKKTHKECNLFGPYVNILAAAKYLKWQLNRYNHSWTNAIAAYTSGSVRS